MLNDDQSREYNRAKTLSNFFSQNTDVIATLQPFSDEVEDFTTNLTTLESYIPNKDVVTKGISEDKMTMRQQTADELDQICKSARAFAIKQNNASLAAEMNLTSRKIMRLKDSDILALAQNVSSLLTPLLSDAGFTPYGITAKMLKAAVTDAATFNSSIGAANVSGAAGSVANKNINATIKLLHANIEQFDLLVGFFKTSNPDFVAGYHLNSAVDNTGVRHTGVEGTVTDAATGKGIAGATVSILNTTKSATTDLNGHYSISRVTTGNYNILVSATGYAAQTIMQHIRRAHTEELDVKLAAVAGNGEAAKA